MEKKKIGAIVAGTVATAGLAATGIYAYKKSKKKKAELVDEIYDDYKLNHANSCACVENPVEDFQDKSVKKHIMKRGK